MSLLSIGAVIVAHNTRDDVLTCLATIPASLHPSTIVVDNGSTDATTTAIRSRFPAVHVLELANAGFGRGANAGVRALKSDVVMVANADVRFGDGVFDRLARELRDYRDVAAAGPLVTAPDGAPQSSARRIPTLAQTVGHALLGRVRPSNRWSSGYRGDDLASHVSRDAEWLSGCAVMLRREAFEQVQGFDPGFFLYVEDVDLSVRLRAAGWRLRYVPEVAVIHRHGASTSRRPLRSLVEHARSLDRYHRRHRRSVRARLATPLIRAGLAVWVAIGAAGRAASRLADHGHALPSGEDVNDD